VYCNAEDTLTLEMQRVKDKKKVTKTNLAFEMNFSVINYSLPLTPHVFDERHRI